MQPPPRPSSESQLSGPGHTAWWLACASPRYGLYSTWLLLAITILIALSPIEFAAGPRADVPATIFSWLPLSLLQNGVFFLTVRCLLIGSAVLWALQIRIPWSSWSTVLFGLLYWSLRMENLTNGAHIFNVTNMLLVVHAMWFQFYARPIREWTRTRDPAIRAYPKWVFMLCLFYLGWFHTMAGFTKIAASGLGWGDGVSLQLWVNLFGWEPSPFGQLLQYDSRLTALLQTGALLIECASILIIFNRWIRYGIGLGLFGFYLGVLTTFVTFGFHFNALLVFWFLLPVDWWLGLTFTDQTDWDESGCPSAGVAQTAANG